MTPVGSATREDVQNEEPDSRSSWPDRPTQARAVAAAGESANLSSAATATMTAEERRATKPSARDGNWTKSTFDNLIDALKHGRTAARE